MERSVTVPIALPVLLAVIVTAVLVTIIFLASTRGRRGSPEADRIERIAARIDELAAVFTVPVTRGGIGETLLEQFLSSWLPKSAYDLQFGFRSGARVDAVIRLGNTIVPVDAKFPLEAVRRAMTAGEPQKVRDRRVPADVRRAILKHVSDIAENYIRPEEGTMRFALMYLPSERVYHYIFVENEDGLLGECLSSGVVPSSPGNLFLYLQTVAYGLRGFSFSARYEAFAAVVDELKAEFDRFRKSYTTASGHLKNLSRSYDDGVSRIERLADVFEKLDST